MTDLRTQIRDFADEFASTLPSVEVEDVMARQVALDTKPPQRGGRGWRVAVVAAAVVLFVGLLLVVASRLGGEPAPVVTEPPPTPTIPRPTEVTTPSTEDSVPMSREAVDVPGLGTWTWTEVVIDYGTMPEPGPNEEFVEFANLVELTTGYVAGGAAMWVSDDGVSWRQQPLPAELEGRHIHFFRHPEGSLMAETDEGVHLSTDEGLTWMPATPDPPLPGHFISDDPDSSHFIEAPWDTPTVESARILTLGGSLYAVVSGDPNGPLSPYHNSVWRSDDEGVSWRQMGTIPTSAFGVEVKVVEDRLRAVVTEGTDLSTGFVEYTTTVLESLDGDVWYPLGTVTANTGDDERVSVYLTDYGAIRLFETYLSQSTMRGQVAVTTDFTDWHVIYQQEAHSIGLPRAVFPDFPRASGIEYLRVLPTRDSPHTTYLVGRLTR